MRIKLATLALTGALAVTGAVLGPAVSYAATSSADAASDRISSLKNALAGLVSNGTLTQAQADSVASSLAESMPPRRGPGGGRGGGIDLEVAAETLGLTVEELRAQSRAGRTLAQIADAQGVSQDDLVAALVEAAEARLAQAVTDGRLTQEQADARAADLEARITEKLDEVCAPGGRAGQGKRGPARAETPPAAGSTAPSGATTSAV